MGYFDYRVSAAMLRHVKWVMVILLAVALLLAPATAYANSAQPPSIVIIVQDPPQDLTITLKGDWDEQGVFAQRSWEGYYAFYHGSRYDELFEFEVTLNGETSIAVLDREGASKDEYGNYSDYYYLDLATLQFSPEEDNPLRTFAAVAFRVILTLVLEGIVFWLFGFRKKSSWIAFLSINIVTQICLNVWLVGITTPFTSYPLFTLIVGEFFVFMAEMIAFTLIVQEKPGVSRGLRLLCYAFVANLVSLVAGGTLFTLLPV